MHKGFGIAALVLAIIGVVLPVFGVWLSALACVIAVFAALGGDRAFSVATSIIHAANVFLLSPLYMIGLTEMAKQGSAGANVAVIVLMIAIIAPLVGIWLNASGKIVLGVTNR